jgi:hypothetical protein
MQQRAEPADQQNVEADHTGAQQGIDNGTANDDGQLPQPFAQHRRADCNRQTQRQQRLDHGYGEGDEWVVREQQHDQLLEHLRAGDQRDSTTAPAHLSAALFVGLAPIFGELYAHDEEREENPHHTK